MADPIDAVCEYRSARRVCRGAVRIRLDKAACDIEVAALRSEKPAGVARRSAFGVIVAPAEPVVLIGCDDRSDISKILRSIVVAGHPGMIDGRLVDEGGNRPRVKLCRRRHGAKASGLRRTDHWFSLRP